jgi:hypothetical protein
VNQAAASQYAEVVQATLSQQDYLSALPLAGRDDYLQALDTAVQAALAEEKPSQEALAACAKQWSDITQQRGHKQQQEAYRRSVEVGP